MKNIQSFLVMLLGILLFFIALPYLWILLLVMVAGFVYLYYKMKRAMNQAQKDIHNTWNSQYSESTERKNDTNIIDVEYEEREIENE